jgi:imidazolonepropionase-like amidohydrolase
MKRFLFAILFLAAPLAAQQTAITNVRLFDGTRVTPHATVVIDGARIVAAGAKVAVPAGATVVDGSGKTLLPGLIDSHTHVFPGTLERALRFGVTTEMDMFTSPRTLGPLRAEQAKGPVTSRADIYSAGILVTVAGGHGSEYFPIPTFKTGDDAQAFIDARIAEGSDYIKLIVETGEAYGMKRLPTLSKSDLTLLIAAAHKRGKLAVVHISTLSAARDAIDAGADALVHIFADKPPDADFGAFVAAHHAFVVPTLTVNESTTGVASGASLIADTHLAAYLNSDERDNLKASFPFRTGAGAKMENAFEAVRQLKRAGVPILAGTDAPNPGTSHGASMHRELELLVKAGLTPAEALAAATSVPAKQFKLDDRGRIAPGLRADLLLVDGDPTTDIRATRNIVTIWRNGAALDRKPESKKEAPAAAVVPAIGDGMLSNFDSGDMKPAFGSGWEISTDSIMGGTSTAAMDIVDGGANGTAKALHIHADTKPGSMFPWAGAMLMLGATPMQPVDVSSKGGLSFFAKGDSDLRVMLFAASAGRIPRLTTVHAGAGWTEITLPWSAFSVDGKDVQAFLICGPEKGMVDFVVDEVRLK